MHYCGLDVSLKTTHVYIENEHGERVERMAVATTAPALTDALTPYAAALKVAVEAGSQSVWIADLLVALGAQVHVVHPLKVKWIAESKKKTDRIDAQLLAHLLRIGGLPIPVHVPSRASRALRQVLQARRQLVQTRTRLGNMLRGLLHQEQVALPTNGLKSMAGWRRLLEQSLSPAVRVILEEVRTTLDATTASIKALERELRARTSADPRVARLQTIPGVGILSAQTLVSTVDRIERFPSAKQLIGYTGLAPTVRASGERVTYGSITKQGRGEIRAVWLQAAHAALKTQHPEAKPLQRWWARVAQRRGKKIAFVALARKLLTIAFHLWREATVYDGRRLRMAASVGGQV